MTFRCHPKAIRAQRKEASEDAAVRGEPLGDCGQIDRVEAVHAAGRVEGPEEAFESRSFLVKGRLLVAPRGASLDMAGLTVGQGERVGAVLAAGDSDGLPALLFRRRRLLREGGGDTLGRLSR